MKTTNIKAMTKDPLAWPACCAANAINAFAGVIAAAMVIAGQAAAATASKPSPRAQETQNVSPVVTNEQALYQFLIAEIAGQRGRAQLAATGMLDLAARTRDARVARRAAEIAFQTRQTAEARDALLLWLELEPDSTVARQALGALLGTQGPLENVIATMTEWLREQNAVKKHAPVLFAQTPHLLAHYADRQKVAVAVAEFSLPFQHLAEAQYALGVTAMLAGNRQAAAAGLDLALKKRPGFARAAIARAQLMRGATDGGQIGGKMDNDTAVARFLSDFLKMHPGATDVRIAHARLLVGMKALPEARESFRLAAKELPLDAELPYAVGLISLQIEDWDEAEKQFQRTLELRPRDKNPVFFNLAMVAEGKNDAEGAVNWYRQIGEGDYFVGAQLKIARHLAKRDGLEAGRNFLREAQKAQESATAPPLQEAEAAQGPASDTREIRAQLVLAEVQMLRELGGGKALDEAYQVLTEALAKQPESIALRYDRAMVAEKLDHLDKMEQDLRTVMKVKPDHAHAYNALGYSFAERGIRLDDAYQLIQKALSLAPGDPFIQDSLGWVQFKMGRLDDALSTLEKAYTIRRDPEIAAHLGEVMWRVGKRAEALVLWQNALKDFPGNALLIEVMARFGR